MRSNQPRVDLAVGLMAQSRLGALGPNPLFTGIERPDELHLDEDIVA